MSGFSTGHLNLAANHMNKIRPYCNRDLADVINIYALTKMDELKNEKQSFQFIPLTQDKNRYRQLLESKIYVYEENGDVIGYCSHFENEIRSIHVYPEYRRRGIGNEMLEHLLNSIIGTPMLFVVKSNVQAKCLYEKHGFRVVDELEKEYNGVFFLANKMEKIG
jgi:putative acetyltransferase